MRILLIDDDEMVRSTLETGLVSIGIEVDSFSDGHAGIARIERGKLYDAVVTDIYMPRMDGLELIRRVRGLDPTLPVIAMTGGGRMRAYGASEPEFLRMAGSLGAIRTIKKPFRSSELVALLDEAVKGRV
jgi:CheY-like chemotaxis protein